MKDIPSPQSSGQFSPASFPLPPGKLSSWPAGAKEGRKKTLGHQTFPQGGGKMKVSGLGCKEESGPVSRPGLLGKGTALSAEAQQGSQRPAL